MPAAIQVEKRTAFARKQKLCEQVAQQIIGDIISLGWKTGDVLGTEPELLARYNVSRSTFREAVRQVERHGAARMRRGSRGGLVVSSPPRGAAVRAMITFFELTRIEFAEQHEAREQLEVVAVRLASERMTPGGAAELVAIAELLRTPLEIDASVTATVNLQVAIAKATLNPSLPLFIETLNGVLREILKVLRIDALAVERDRELSARFRQELIEAMIAKNAARAESLVRQDVGRRLLAMTSRLTNSGARKGMIDYFRRRETEAEGLKLSEKVAFAIVDEIEKMGWEENRNLGNEAALQKRLSVSRAVLREAIRQLELHGIANIKSGIQGGLYIGKVDSAYTEKIVCTYLRSTTISMIHLWETQSNLEIFAAERLAMRSTPADIEALKSHLDRMKSATAANYLQLSSPLHAEIADRTGNRVLSLFIRILLRYGLGTLPPVWEASLPLLLRIHETLVEAIQIHDAVGARHIMTNLFSRSRGWVVTGES
ncbi:MAG TPA: FCD domain-containing protein [Steroidobacteraceae bacterium]|jgi:DNA-binding FadR family transcriptional regulator